MFVLRGQEATSRDDEIEGHLSNCPVCAEFASRLQSDDGVVHDLRRGIATLTETDHPSFRAVAARCRELPVWLVGHGTWTESSNARDSEHSIPASILELLSPAHDASEVGRLARYRILGFLGSGGTGVVLDALDTVLSRPVALKIMWPDRVQVSATARQRFLREASLAATVRHENVVSIYDVGECHGVPYLALERLPGETLQDRVVREGKLPLAIALLIVESLLRGLRAAHQRGLIHRDITPANIWLTSPVSDGSPPSLQSAVAPRRSSRFLISAWLVSWTMTSI